MSVKTGRRPIKNGREYDRFFKPPSGDNVVIKQQASVRDTVALMKKVINETLSDTATIAHALQVERVKETCKAIWEFCFHHFQYKKDERWKEQVRRPARSWKDRKRGIDCDCFTVLIGSILTHLGIRYVIRLTRYTSPEFEHVYPVAITPEGKEVIMDCVVHKFNYEVPYTAKKDEEMELQYLNGVPGERYNEFGDLIRFENDLPVDAEDLFLDELEIEGSELLDGLHGRARRKARKARRKEKRRTRRKERKERKAEIKKLPFKERIKTRLRNGLNKINRFNPATVLLRAGMLASMKLNVMKVASKLRYAYWSESQARANNFDMRKYADLQKVRQKVEKAYYSAGGKTGKLKKSILEGRGNRDRMVALNGLGFVDNGISDDDDLHTILGEDLFEEIDQEGLDGLGAITAGAAIASASGFIGTIAKLFKKMGGLFKKGTPQGDQADATELEDDQFDQVRTFGVQKMNQQIERFKARLNNGATASKATGDIQDDFSFDEGEGFDDDIPLEQDFDAVTVSRGRMTGDTEGARTADDEKSDEEEKKGIGAWIKDNPGKSALIGVGIVGAIAGGVYYMKRTKKSKGVAGIPKKKKRKSTKRKRRKTTRSKRSNTPRKKTTTRRKKTTTRRKKTTARKPRRTVRTIKAEQLK